MSALPRPIFLSGPMGAGKTTVGRIVAATLGAPFVDLDAAIEARHGASVRDIFRARGEASFRALERARALEVAAEAPAVIALGGGTVIDRTTRRALLERGAIVTLMASPAALAARLGDDRSRPLLDGEDARAVLARLLEQREAAYAECAATLDAEHASPEALAAQVIGVAREDALVVPLGTRTYGVHVGRGVRHRLGALLSRERKASRVIVVTDENVPHLEGLPHLEGQAREGALVLPAGEAHKTLASVEAIWDHALARGVDRDALILAVGGGVVGDLAGFAAATLLRGVRFAQLPTTLLAMVDASVGGKTGFDRPEGKNLVGAFHQPRFVLADLDTLASLPPEERTSGLAEVIKSAWIEGEHDVSALETDLPAILAGDAHAPHHALEHAVRRAVRTKIRIVSADEAETGVRAHLNLGHTLGHAIESESGYTLRHGHAVALGLVAAMRVGVRLGDATPHDLARMTALLSRAGLPTDLDRHLGEPVIARLGADKKRAGAAVRFVVPGAPGQVRLETLEFQRIGELLR